MTHKDDDGGRLLQVDTLARVEGEGAMRVVVHDGAGDRRRSCGSTSRRGSSRRSCAGAAWTEPPDITARICGICPVAYQMSACLALEDACGVTVTEEIRLLRRLLYCGEWIESHALHVYLLHAPDFLGYAGAIEMARDHADVVEQGLRLKKAGNALMTAGRRPLDPPGQREGRRLLPAPDPGRAAGAASARSRGRSTTPSRRSSWSRASSSPTSSSRYEYVAMRAAERLPARGRLDREQQRPGLPAPRFATTSPRSTSQHSNALHARLIDGSAVRRRPAGPLHPEPRPALAVGRARRRPRQGSAPTCRNPFRSIVVRAVELVYAVRRGAADHRQLGRRRGPVRAVTARAGDRARRHRGAARHPLPPLHPRARTAPSWTP